MMKRFENMTELDGPDRELADALSSLDPASSDPNYWLRFRIWVMKGAARELARRRLLAHLTVGDVLQSWSRAVVPTAVLTALFAGMLLIRSGMLNPPQPIGLEELLVSEIEAEPLQPANDPVAFASEIF